MQPADAAIRIHDVVIGGVRLTAGEAAPDGSLHGRLIVDVERCRTVSRLHTEPGASPEISNMPGPAFTASETDRYHTPTMGAPFTPRPSQAGEHAAAGGCLVSCAAHGDLMW